MLCWLAAWLALSVPWPSNPPSLHPVPPRPLAVQHCSMWALCAPSDRVKLFLLSGGQGPSVSTSALNRAHRNPPSLPNQDWNSALSPLAQVQINLVPLSFSLFPFSISWHTVTPLIEIINQTGQIRLQIKINYAWQPSLRSPDFCRNQRYWQAFYSLILFLINPRCPVQPAGWTFRQTVDVYYCFIDINKSYLQGWWLLRPNLPSM